ncbi:ATP-dependent helicase, partial [Streptomyces pseudogriseolus]
MTQARANDRSGRNRSAGKGAPRGVRRSGAAGGRGGAPRQGQGKGKGGAGRRTVTSGEFALPETITPALPAVEAFEDLGLPDAMLATLGVEGVTAPFPIQAATLPNSLAGRDVLGRGRTGSGKT